MRSIGRIDFVYGKTRGFWFQCWRPVMWDIFKVVDVGCGVFLFAIYIRPKNLA
jgi:hypothetical protein